MSAKVAIVAYACLKNEKDNPLSRERMYYKLAKEIYEKAGIDPDGVDTFVLSSNDFMDGRTISEVFLVQRIGAYMKDETKVEADALNALMYAAMRIMSGNYKTALVVSASKAASEFKPLLVQNQALDPVYERPRNVLNTLSGAALQARLYMNRYGVDEKCFHLFAEKNFSSARLNPLCIEDIEYGSEKEVESSEVLYEPIRRGHLPPFADGGCAVLLASEDVANKFTDKPVWIKGMGYNCDTYYLGDRDLVTLPSLRAAAQQAYKMAGISDPVKDLSLAEVYTHAATEEPVIIEGLGLSEDGKAGREVTDGRFSRDGEIPVNPSGGVFIGHPYNVSGLMLALNAVIQLRGEMEEELQVKNATTAVVHSQEGVCAQFNTVVVLGI